ncbi:bifunctional phosphatase PAP2/O-acyltransferase family protein [Actinomadura opuntiae]|uniref:bifunctional phosphatase PAP2/O-acyltransferase family protein n=1 Tax=Actinomadura sp. OS1-43 TaxID=604315 RepID=UPI00255B109D|nr:phosphatase PAP2 family protein [Actinomadura sp. OS1-43]MDL4817428.1 phosphatase PAP2 family protein [Actinomadura sp. OS1-43]
MTPEADPSAPAGHRPPLARELAFGLSLFALYAVAAAFPVGDRRAAAADHGRQLYDLERTLHIAAERPLNDWLASHRTVAVAANYEYAAVYLVSTLGLLAWLYRRRPERYRVARTSFALINVIGAVCFALWPVAPPRLVPDLGFVDTVLDHGTWGSWGSPVVDHADRLAAMPSLHVAWALWVSVELARLSVRRWLQAASLLHVFVTLYVIMATANHYLLDAAGAVAVVWFAYVVTDRDSGRPHVPIVPPEDAFFLAVESDRAPQHVGGLIFLDAPDGSPSREDLIATLRGKLDELPRLRQRLSPPSRLRRRRWVAHPVIDWDWHVRETTLPEPGDTALNALVAALQGEPLPRDRPMWRMIAVRGYAPDRAAVVFLMHHVVADGMGVITHVLRMLTPPDALPVAGAGPSAARRALATVAGIAQLATESRQRTRLPSTGTGERVFGTFRLPMPAVRDLARRHGVRVTDVVLCALAGGLRRVGPMPAGSEGGRVLRVAVPLMTGGPEVPPEGNHTSAVMVDLPYGPMSEVERLRTLAAATRRLRSGTRALASAFVMQRASRALPPVLHDAFARTVYGDRTFQAIATNLPGSNTPTRLAGAPLAVAHPIVPTGPGAPLAVGALGWSGMLNLGISAEATLLDDVDALCRAMRDVIEELGAADVPERPGPAEPPGPPGPAGARPARGRGGPSVRG